MRRHFVALATMTIFGTGCAQGLDSAPGSHLEPGQMGAGQVIEAFSRRASGVEPGQYEWTYLRLCEWLETRGFTEVPRDRLPRAFAQPQPPDRSVAEEAFFLGSFEGSDPFLVMVRHFVRSPAGVSARVSWAMHGSQDQIDVQEKKANAFTDQLGIWWAINDPAYKR